MFDRELNYIKELISDKTANILPNNALYTFLNQGSKMVRSKLALLYLASNNIEINEEGLKIIAAGELIHNASLMHDDVLDNAKQRRNKKTLAEEFSPKVSILCGDFLVSKSINILNTIKNPDIRSIYNNAVETMTVTEIRQFLKRGEQPSRNEYLSFCEGKTSALFTAILESLAVFYNLDSNYAKNLGKYFGINFQIKNDLEPNSASEDKANGVYTAETVMGIENAKSLSDNNIEEMRLIINNFPNKERAKNLEELILGI